ncbi:hypothetical protein DL96DRAFT_1821484 [Flagelloscypha sp. PMI_526]|nr:hypothetical protein DL96DRAFT_1821484 [Flagelloscypha sp. PMI_526]
MSSEVLQNQSHLPEELIFYIFEIILDIPQSSSSVDLLLVSKRVYHWALPQFYRDLKFLPDDDGRPHGGVQRTRLIENAHPTSLTLVRDLQCGAARDSHSFSPFPSLKQLALWGPHLWNVEQTYSLLDLSLEELLIWTRHDISVLRNTLQCCQRISEKALHKSLRKMSSPVCLEEEIFKAFPYLTHILFGSIVIFFDEKSTKNISMLLLRESIKCYIIFSRLVGGVFARLSGSKLADGAKNCRVVQVKARPNHLNDYNKDPNLDFWGEQAEMWRRAEKAVAENTNSHVRNIFGNW